MPRSFFLHARVFVFAGIAFAIPGLETAWAQTVPHVVVAGPATGRHAQVLPAIVAGARRGSAGTDVRISDVDDGCDAARAQGAAEVIAAMKPDLVIGHPCPAAAIAAARVYAQHGVVFIALGVRHPALTEKRAGQTIFRWAGRDDRQGAAAAAELAALAPGGEIAIVQDRTAYARGLTAAVTAALAARNLPAPTVIPIVAGRRDYDAELARLTASPPQAIFFAGYPSEAAVVLRELRKAKLGAALVASDANATEEFAQTVAAAGGSQGAVKVMVHAAGSGGLGADALDDAAARAVGAWRGAHETGDAVRALGATEGNRATAFDEKGDARIDSFTAVPLVAGRWSGSATASE